MFCTLSSVKGMGKEMDCLINLVKISKEIKNRKVLQELNLDVFTGDFISIMGSSGAGKTTLLNIIALLDKATSGEYVIDGKLCDNLSFKKQAHIRNRLFGFIMQDFALIENYSVCMNIQIPLIYSKEYNDRKANKLRIYELIEKFGLQGKEEQIVSTLSGGERQRVALIRAIVNDPKIILADEPTSALDSSNKEYICNFLKELNNEGKTIILVTHDKEISEIAKRKIILSSGVISEDIALKN